jgi:hypothetical protein
MGGTDQMLALRIEKSPRKPVQFHRDMAAAVQVGVDLALESDREGATAMALMNHSEGLSLSSLPESFGRAQDMPRRFIMSHLIHPPELNRPR